MMSSVKKIAEQVQALPAKELEEFLSWLAEYELAHADAWESEIERDSEPGGGLDTLIARARTDIVAGNTKSLDEILHDA